ncbi:unnamed protein product [Urochloa decumbens]|uniref:Transmembrane protein n=1 Tax=Urochloa decumbens TaxID=240449 RepID=A0ABC9GVN3_9POAL
MVGLLQLVKDAYFGPPPGKGVIQDLEHAMRTKGGLTKEEETKLRVVNFLPTVAFVLSSGLGSYAGWFSQGLGHKLVGLPPPVFTRFITATGGAYIMGKAIYRATLHSCPVALLNTEEGRMKMELANIILTKHSDDEYLVKAVKRHFFAEHLFDDLHQDQPLFRWHPRRSYTDSAFVERMKEIEAMDSYDEPRSVSRETTADNRPSGDLMEDPFACILGSPGDVESNNRPGNSSTVLKRSELRARRRSHRHHHHRHADDKFAAL